MVSLRYLLDTNVISEGTKPAPNQAVVQKLIQHQEEVATASVVLHELLYGCLRLPESKRRRSLLDYVNQVPLTMPVLDYDLQAAQWHATERARLVKIGRTPAFFDGQIASIAHCHRLTLVTNNVADFQDFEYLTLENWFLLEEQTT